jgi:6-phosphofructokinase 1
MRRIGILTAGGDTPALNATISGAVERANQMNVEVIGIIKGFSGLLDARAPHVHLNPLYRSVPELDPNLGGTIIGSSRHYVDPNEKEQMKKVVARLQKIGIEGLICIGGDGTINGMQPISEFFPCVLAPKTIDNDLGLNYVEEPYEWQREDKSDGKGFKYTHNAQRSEIQLGEIVNYATPGYATSVFVVVQAIQRIRTTAESHRRICIVEVMGRDSGYISLGSAFGQPDMILIPEIPVDFQKVERRVRELYDIQKHAVIVVGEGIVDEDGHPYGAKSKSFDPAGNVIYSGASEHLASMLEKSLGDEFFQSRRRHDHAKEAIFTRKVGHTQRGGRPVRFDRFYAAQLGGKAVDLLLSNQNNCIATLHYNHDQGFTVSSIDANKLRDRWGIIHARNVHSSMYDTDRMQPSKFGKEYLLPIFRGAVGMEDVEPLATEMFHPGNLYTKYQSVNIDLHKRIKYLDENAPL